MIKGSKNHLEEDLADWKSRRRKIHWMTFFGIVLFFSGPATHRPILSFLGLLVVAFSYMFGRQAKSTIEILKFGIDGEQLAESVFGQLPMDYAVYSDLEIHIGEKSSQLDHVVIGPSGVFVIETKNMVGRIEGHAEEPEWTQYKTTSSGQVYEKTFYNPVKQVGTQVYRLSELLKKEHIHVWIQGVVFFSNHDADVHVVNSQVPVFSAAADGESAILKYIIHHGRNELSEDVQEKIGKILHSTIMVQVSM